MVKSGEANINGGKLKDLVDQYLRTQIFKTRSLSPGDQINERALSRILQVSRAPIREALKELEAQGLVASEQYRGWFVADFREEEFVEINKLRTLLEYNLLESVLSSGGPDDEELAPIEAINEEMRSITKLSESDEAKAFKYARQEMLFHTSLYALAKDNCIWTRRLLRNFSFQIQSALHRWLLEEWQMEMGVAFHDKLLECLRKKDSAELRKMLFTRLDSGPWKDIPHNPGSRTR